MRVLHLFSNVKLTGPAETVLLTCRYIKERGVDVYFACGSYPGSVSSIQKRADEYELEPLTSFKLRKHFDIVSSIKDIPDVMNFIEEEEIDIVHTHLLGDHIVGGWAARRSSRNPPVVRTVHSLGSMFARLRARYLLKNITDAVVVPSEWHKKRAMRIWRLPEEFFPLVEPLVDIERFDSSRSIPDRRHEFDLSDDDFVVGVVARVQKQRRFKLFLEAVRLANAKEPRIKGVVIGRGTHIETVAIKPAERMGLSSIVKFVGYHTGDDYVSVLNMLDVKVFLVSGTDETARALREALSMGKPSIVSKRGMLPEVVRDNLTGFVVEERPDAIAEKVLRLCSDGALYGRLSSEAKKDVVERFSPEKYADRMLSLYERLLRRKKPIAF